jgi:hypothetical protein
MGDEVSKDGAAQAIHGLLQHDDGAACPARFYYGDGEPQPHNCERIDPERYTTWVEDDGAIGIRRGTSVSVGATKQYAARYDEVDWGN